MLLTLCFQIALAGRDDDALKIEGRKQLHEGSLKVGDPAPDVGVVEIGGKPTTLFANRQPGRPLVLIFGSFT